VAAEFSLDRQNLALVLRRRKRQKRGGRKEARVEKRPTDRRWNQGCQMVCLFSNQKIPIWPNLGGAWRCCYILWTFGPFYNHLVYFMDIWYILW
jgi:hypothetical protein